VEDALVAGFLELVLEEVELVLDFLEVVLMVDICNLCTKKLSWWGSTFWTFS